MKVKYKSQPSHVYTEHYMRGGSVIGSYFKVNQIKNGSGFGNVIASVARGLIPI